MSNYNKIIMNEWAWKHSCNSWRVLGGWSGSKDGRGPPDGWVFYLFNTKERKKALSSLSVYAGEQVNCIFRGDGVNSSLLLIG